MGFCTAEEYREFLRSCPEFERMLVRSGIILIKYWFSVSDQKQKKRSEQALSYRLDNMLSVVSEMPEIFHLS